VADHASDSAEEKPKKGPGLMTLVKAGVIVAVIVVIEVAAAAMLFPSAEETKALAEQLAKHSSEEQDEGEHAAEGESAEAEGHGEHTKEATLGTYHIVSFNPKTRKTMSVDFELTGVVLAEEEPEFTELYTVHEKRVNEQVTIAVRGMEVGDFSAPELGLMKRVILEKVNRAIGKPLVREVVVGQFSNIER
jgi:flagellar FliL protein